MESDVQSHKQTRDQALFDRAGVSIDSLIGSIAAIHAHHCDVSQAQEKIKDLEKDIKEHLDKYDKKCCEVTEISKRLAEKNGTNRALDDRYEDLLISHAELQKAKEDLERWYVQGDTEPGALRRVRTDHLPANRVSLGAAEGREVQLREQLDQSAVRLPFKYIDDSKKVTSNNSNLADCARGCAQRAQGGSRRVHWPRQEVSS